MINNTSHSCLSKWFTCGLWSNPWLLIYCQFTVESSSERILKVGRHLAKLWVRKLHLGHRLLEHCTAGINTCEVFTFWYFRHEVAEVAGLASFSFGQEEIDRCVIVWKKVWCIHILLFNVMLFYSVTLQCIDLSWNVIFFLIVVFVVYCNSHFETYAVFRDKNVCL